MAIAVHCDGLCEPINPGGTATYGFVVDRVGQRLHAEGGVVARGKGATNNVAEYTAAIRALEWLEAHGYSGQAVAILSDSRLLIEQLSGEWAVRSARIAPLYQRARALARKFKTRFCWIPREQNEEADALSVVAYVEAMEADRHVRAATVALEPLGDGRFRANERHIVDPAAGVCSCEDFRKVHSQRFPIRCKHLLAVELRRGNKRLPC